MRAHKTPLRTAADILSVMESVAGALVSAAQPAAAVFLGWALRRTHLCSTSDGETAAKYAVWVTLPSLILQTFNGVTLSSIQLPVLAGALAASALSAGLTWLAYRQRHPKERGLLAGSAVGASLALAAYPVIQSFFGAPGLRVALLAGAVNSLAVWVASYLLFSTAGAAFPEKYEHLDGGTYRGEWLGMLKQGHGVYTYPSGARYEGEWRNNTKEGRGVYRFPKGGVYEGEWRGGKMEGLGVRTFASGKVQSGVWRDGKLVADMEEWQCTLAVEGANEAAAAARRVQVGAGGSAAALQQLLSDPATWALAAAALLALTGRQLTPTLELVTSKLAVAHGPLALAALGLTLELGPPEKRQIGDVYSVLSLRLLPPLLLAAAACLLLPRLGWTAVQTLGMVAPALLCAVAPVAPQVLDYAHRFRLNENLAAAITRSSSAAGLLLMPLLALAATVSAAAGSVLPFLVAVGGVAVAAAGVGLVGAAQDTMHRKVRMTYAPAAVAAAATSAQPGSGYSQRPAAAAGAATAGAATAGAATAGAATAATPAAVVDGSSGVDAPSAAAAGAAASPPADADASAGAGAAEPPQQQQRQQRPSAFSDVRQDQPPQPPQLPQALPGLRNRHSSRSGSSSGLGGRGRLSWLRPLRHWEQQRSRPAARLLSTTAGGGAVRIP